MECLSFSLCRTGSTQQKCLSVFFCRQHVSGKMKGGECNGRTGQGSKHEVGHIFSKMCRESPENQKLIMTQKENRGNIKVATSFSGTCDGKN